MRHFYIWNCHQMSDTIYTFFTISLLGSEILSLKWQTWWYIICLLGLSLSVLSLIVAWNMVLNLNYTFFWKGTWAMNNKTITTKMTCNIEQIMSWLHFYTHDSAPCRCWIHTESSFPQEKRSRIYKQRYIIISLSIFSFKKHRISLLFLMWWHSLY